ncbi:HU family DNA-binding protein [Woeseiaceae bacterium]|jgi:nucleoid DNA-binding protein|nr:HU family DNA-binding protein [Woeseiaceae bacterium]
MAGKNKSQNVATKSSIFSEIAGDTGLTKKDISAVFDSLAVVMKKNLSGRNAPGSFTIPGLIKIKVMERAATKTRNGTNPFNGKAMTIKAKPATKIVKVAALKRLKDMI